VVSVCLAGVTAWTAPPIVTAIAVADDLSLTCGVSRSAAGQRLSAIGSTSEGFVYASVPEALESADVDVLVDCTSATAVKDHAWSAVQVGVHVVIGSSRVLQRASGRSGAVWPSILRPLIDAMTQCTSAWVRTGTPRSGWSRRGVHWRGVAVVGEVPEG
jgi:hypothetical protein